jgi:hypothetical protein
MLFFDFVSIKASHGTKNYAVGLEMSCPGGAYHWAPEIPSTQTIAGARPGKCELAHNRGAFFPQLRGARVRRPQPPINPAAYRSVDRHNWPAMLMERPSMGIAYVDRQTAALAAAGLLLSLCLGGCATSTTGSSLMDARAEAPALPKTSAYLPVEVLPPAREKPAMTSDERSKLQKELIAARDRQETAGKARGATTQADPAKPQ